MQKRLRLIYLLLLIPIIAIGLATRKAPHLFPSFVSEYGGDTFWALMFFIIFRILWIDKSIRHVAVATFLFCLIIELSQLYQGEWLNKLRETFPGQMLLGHGFLWSDLLCYAVGVLMGWILAQLIERSRRRLTQTGRM
ncbi:MAG: DUF2809 domain-containing protein [Chitinophagaceae bacterium]|nr:DUF2809 domain-containing protein [Chitinophagaceae bacterium]